MDRKAWIVITLCVLGMVFNGWWMMKHPPAVPAPLPKAPVAAAAVTAPAMTAAAAPGVASPTVPAAAGEKVVLTNSNAAYTFTTTGGGIEKVVLLDTNDRVTLNQHGKAAVGALSTAAKSYDDVNYRIIDKTDKSIVFEAELPDKVVIRKDWRFSQGVGSSDHLLEFKLTLTNNSGVKLSKDSYFLYAGAAAELRPDETEKPAFCWNNAGDADYFATTKFRDGSGAFGFGGPVLEHQESFNRLRWAGVMSRFYATLISTVEDQPSRVWSQRFLVDHSKSEFKNHASIGQDYAIHGGLSLAPVELEPGAQKVQEYRIYLGAKIYHELKLIDEAEAPGRSDRQMRDVMFYGRWFGWVSRILVACLRFFHDLTGNWGVAIILLTIAVRSLMWPLQARSNRQMKKMGKLSPMLKEIQEKYKDEPQKLNAEMMKLYKDYGVNPVGGCLPLFIQFPIFIGFYTALRYATELRGQPFVSWVKDLSLPDTVTTLHFPFSLPLVGDHFDVNPLPLLMGLTMFLQMKLTPQPATTDKMQARIFMFMPFMFLFFCYTFASALALYWTFTNIFMIVQAQITRLWQGEEPKLEKVKIVENAPASPMSPVSPFGHPNKPKKDKPAQPRLGGGGSRSTRPKKP